MIFYHFRVMEHVFIDHSFPTSYEKRTRVFSSFNNTVKKSSFWLFQEIFDRFYSTFSGSSGVMLGKIGD